MTPSDWTGKLVALGTIGILLGVSAWLRPLQPAEWLPSRGINAVSVAIPGVRPVRLRDLVVEGRGQNGSPNPRAHTRPIPPQPHQVVDVLPAVSPLTATDVPVALTPAPPREATVAVAAASAGDPVADAFVTAGRHTGNALQTGATKTGGAFRTAGRAIRSIF